MLPFTDNKSNFHHHNSAHNDGNGNSTSLHGNTRIKVEQDIAFLTDRIAAMKQQPNQNTKLIEHYQSMLNSRESVLKWLMDGCDDETCGLSDHQYRA